MTAAEASDASELATPAADAAISHAAARAYWQSVDADVNGMLGGYPYVSRVDLQGSRAFLAKLGIRSWGARRGMGRGTAGEGMGEDGNGDEGEGEGGSESARVERGGAKVRRAVDCGAGIGRITEGLLLSIAETVDIVEPIAKFTDVLRDRSGIGQIWNTGLEAWDVGSQTQSEETKYDLIWNQWCLGHLTDAQLVTYLQKCRQALSRSGLVVVKENLSTSHNDIFDEVDSSVTRTEAKFKEIFIEAGFKIRKSDMQRGMPKELFPVRMWALQPS